MVREKKEEKIEDKRGREPVRRKAIGSHFFNLALPIDQYDPRRLRPIIFAETMAGPTLEMDAGNYPPSARAA
jgi:hypothetical protein